MIIENKEAGGVNMRGCCDQATMVPVSSLQHCKYSVASKSADQVPPLQWPVSATLGKQNQFYLVSSTVESGSIKHNIGAW